jgi:Tol biopolymer transport system component
MSERTVKMHARNFGLKRLALSVCAAGALSSFAHTSMVSAQAPALVGSFVAVNNGHGNQTNPHVACDLVSYTNDDLGVSTIHYYDFASNTDHVVPGNSVDLLSDVAGTRVALTEVTSDGDTVAFFDTLTSTRTNVPGTGHSAPALGGNLMAFEDRSLVPGDPNQSEISVYDISTSTSLRLTNDALMDRRPAVSPNGEAIVWEKCQTNGFGCDIYSATPIPGGFTTHLLTGSPGEDRLPDTDGTRVVYTSDRTGEWDVYYQPVGGGAETRLAIPGDQRDPRIAGDLISFESQSPGGDYDVYVYDISTNALYQITNTSGVDERLNDISVCGTSGRIVYVIPGDGAFDVYAFTFDVPNPPPPTPEVSDLVALVQSFNLPHGVESSLLAKLNDALAALSAGDTATACIDLNAFINETQAQAGKKLTPTQAEQLIALAEDIMSALGCP